MSTKIAQERWAHPGGGTVAALLGVPLEGTLGYWGAVRKNPSNSGGIQYGRAGLCQVGARAPNDVRYGSVGYFFDMVYPTVLQGTPGVLPGYSGVLRGTPGYSGVGEGYSRSTRRDVKYAPAYDGGRGVLYGVL